MEVGIVARLRTALGAPNREPQDGIVQQLVSIDERAAFSASSTVSE
jgi:hypothetical protein